MNKTFLPKTIILILLYMFTNTLLAQTVTVSGAGLSYVNHVYSLLDTENGRPRYRFSEYRLSYHDNGFGPEWSIWNSLSNVLYYYSLDLESMTPPTTEWVPNFAEYDPAPNISYDALPVELTSFTANYSNSKVLLNWNTATEVNNYGFEIQLKKDNGEWRKIGFQQGHGNSNSPKSYSFVDNLALTHDLNLDRISYRLKQIDFDGKFEYSDVVEVKVEKPTQFILAQNYPNPFNPETTIHYQLPQAGHVTLKVYNVLGKEVAKLVDEQKTAGTHYCKLSTANYQLSSGVYFYTLKTDNGFAATKKLLFIK